MKTLILSGLLLPLTTAAYAQLDTLGYPAERLQIRALLHQPGGYRPGPTCRDMVAVGPKGDISFSEAEWRAAQAKEKVVFRSVRVVPGSEIIRIYNANSAVVNWLADVRLSVAGQDVALKVRRLEVFIKQGSTWCRVAGQGTQVDEQLFPVGP
ncbi:nuclear transport factor 2 family protein [Hymenobacter sp. 15J16-1T3B]|uniref:nuclear transport factor 2 family protein n=1 Tax=Hymenobacter sp. 15J16-1T3B TaxID=2886941 RepID=UPI001D11C822|nr:nuclear transport factor 2 family protein [Hymenobacter sp. 15J16-1T3B]MCC3160101.1 nuclear transport factor 2 family protein [Hymenobacter sp. 15J16-1T3B]